MSQTVLFRTLGVIPVILTWEYWVRGTLRIEELTFHLMLFETKLHAASLLGLTFLPLESHPSVCAEAKNYIFAPSENRYWMEDESQFHYTWNLFTMREHFHGFSYVWMYRLWMLTIVLISVNDNEFRVRIWEVPFSNSQFMFSVLSAITPSESLSCT